jgi:hypothetical protein
MKQGFRFKTDKIRVGAVQLVLTRQRVRTPEVVSMCVPGREWVVAPGAEEAGDGAGDGGGERREAAVVEAAALDVALPQHDGRGEPRDGHEEVLHHHHGDEQRERLDCAEGGEKA